MQNILNGLRIIEGSAFIAAPMCGMTLAQLGADVIRFDNIHGGIDYRRWPVTGDNHSFYWADLNKGKRSFAVDLKSNRGRELVTELITADGSDAGIFSTNLPAKGWLSYDSLKARRRDLIQLTIVGDRHGGTALDYTVNAKVGFPAMTGPADDERPVNHILPAWDNITAYMAALSILAAERHRRLTGNGQLVNLSLADCALATMGHLGFIGEVSINKSERLRHGNNVYGALGRDFLSADGKRMMIIAITPKQWSGLQRAGGFASEMDSLESRLKLDFSREGDRFTARNEICEVIDRWTTSTMFKQLKAALDENGCCWGVYQTIQELVEEDIDVSEDNPIFSMVQQPNIGTYLVPGQPMSFSAVERGPATPAPHLGQHTNEILADLLGLSDSEIGKLHDQGIVAG
ncbi:MAG TPA: 2-methylfumaryl-CoA isomerase [Gammaproteobacteria bacterium]|nr:2-methylfumaryl-CoA isomerase [Gammaproteobacteria bacterium]